MERLAGDQNHVAREAWAVFSKPKRSRRMTDLQRVQSSLRRFGYTAKLDPSTEGTGIVLTVACSVDLAERDDPADRIVAGIWKANPDVRMRLVFDDDGRLLSDRSTVNEAARSAS